MTGAPSCKSIYETCQQAQRVVACMQSFRLRAILLDHHSTFQSLVFLSTGRQEGPPRH